MVELTKDQQDCLDFVKSQFLTINQLSIADTPFMVINVGKLNAEANRIANGKEELKNHNETMRIAHQKFIDNIVDNINEDFKIGKIPLKAKRGCGDICIESILGYQTVNNSVRIDVHACTISTEFGSRFTGEFKFRKNYSSTIFYKTANEIFATEIIQKELLYLIEQTKQKMK